MRLTDDAPYQLFRCPIVPELLFSSSSPAALVQPTEEPADHENGD
jgi:hypothetical protein